MAQLPTSSNIFRLPNQRVLDVVIALAFTGIALWAYGSIAGSEQGLRDKDSFCVLGVLCDIHSKEFHCEEDWRGELYKMYMNSLPPEVCNWLGEENFELIFGGDLSLIDLNDDRHMDFKELADEIERRAEKFEGVTNE